MTASLHKNTHHERRVWPTLVNHGTGRTLELDPGEHAYVVTPEGFEDAHLQPLTGEEVAAVEAEAKAREAEEKAEAEAEAKKAAVESRKKAKDESAAPPDNGAGAEGANEENQA